MPVVTGICKLAVYEEGRGKPVVLLHGLISTHRYWNDVAALLDLNKYTVIRPDLLGFGVSPKPKKMLYTLEEQVVCVAEAVSNVKPPYLVVGHSMGACIALKWAVDKPKPIKRLVLTSLPLLKPEIAYQQLASVANRPKLHSNPVIAKAGVRSAAWLSFFPARLMHLQKTWPKHIAEDWTKHGRQAYLKTLNNMIFSDVLLAYLIKVKVPVHIIMGSKDGLIAPKELQRLKELVGKKKNITLEIIDSGHNVPLEHPEIVAKAIKAI